MLEGMSGQGSMIHFDVQLKILIEAEMAQEPDNGLGVDPATDLDVLAGSARGREGHGRVRARRGSGAEAGGWATRTAWSAGTKARVKATG